MGNYSVKDIAEMLNTNPETVRRWIRDGKLKAVQSSRKEGNIVEEGELQKFLAATPKYAKIASMGMAMAMIPVIGGPLAGGFFGGLGLGALKKHFSNINNPKVFPQELIKYLESEVTYHEEKIRQLEKEISKEKQQIDEINKILCRKEDFNSKKDD